MSFADRLLALGLALVQAAVVLGLLIALGRVALGLRNAHHHLIGVLIAGAVLLLWEAGALGELVHELFLAISSGGGPAPASLGGPR